MKTFRNITINISTAMLQWRIESTNLLYYVLGTGIFIGLKLLYARVSADELLFLLAPTDWLVMFFTGSEGFYASGKGFFHNDLDILIEKSCAGINFWLLSTMLCYFLCIPYAASKAAKLALLPLSFIGCWLLTIGVNASRITTAILIGDAGHSLGSAAVIHQVEGSFVYLFFLLLFYKILHHLLPKYYSTYEKSA